MSDQKELATQAQSQRISSLNLVFIGVGVCMFIYHMISTQKLFFNNFEHQNVHLTFSLVLTMLATMTKNRKRWVAFVLGTGILLSILATGYVHLFMEHLEESVGMPEPIDVAVGLVIIALVFETTRQAWGITLPIVGGIFILYFLFGHLLSGPLYHREFAFDYVISYLCTGLTGVYGTFMSISANQIFLFVAFGALLGGVRINDCLTELGKIAGRFSQGGPAHTAVISSSLVGMVSGAAVANVAITGAFTIPYMKKVGFKPEVAGAVEAAASTGGQLMPPIMGAAAFLMAFFVGVPYAEIMIAGIIPAIMFYLGVFTSVQFLSVAEDIQSDPEKPDYHLIFRRLPLFTVPLLVIMALLILRYSPMMAAFWAIISAVVISCIDRQTRLRMPELFQILAKGAVVGAKIGVSLGVVGMMAQVLITTGLGTKIAGLVQTLSGGHLFIALLITMVVSLLLGCGVPPAAAYSMVAIVVAPTLVRMGVPKLPAHFFCFYFAIISAVTPPVALGALAGAGIAEANYFKTAFHAFKLALAGFVAPYFIIYNPAVTLNSKNLVTSIGSVVAIPAAIILLGAVIYNVLLVRLSGVERLTGLGGLVVLMAYCTKYHESFFLLSVGMAFFSALLVIQIRKKLRIKGL